MSTLREYEEGFDISTDGWEPGRPFSVDLRWVASACPCAHGTTTITLAGSGSASIHRLRVGYDAFMQDWTTIKQ